MGRVYLHTNSSFILEILLQVSWNKPYLKPVLITAYHSGMRKGEILNLKWDGVDPIGGFIRLCPEDTKTREVSPIPLNNELTEVFKSIIKCYTMISFSAPVAQ